MKREDPQRYTTIRDDEGPDGLHPVDLENESFLNCSSHSQIHLTYLKKLSVVFSLIIQLHNLFHVSNPRHETGFIYLLAELHMKSNTLTACIYINACVLIKVRDYL